MKTHKQIIGYHIIITCYGFWMPNDPRGSGSFEVRAEWLQPFGKATGTTDRRSRARLALSDEERHRMVLAKQSLKFSPVILDGKQALSVIHGFAAAVRGVDIYACAIMPEHVHVVTGVLQDVEIFVESLKAHSDSQLKKEDRFPHYTALDAEERETIWAERYWKRYIYETEDLLQAIHYAEQNPVKAGLKPQRWSFVRKFP